MKNIFISTIAILCLLSGIAYGQKKTADVFLEKTPHKKENNTLTISSGSTRLVKLKNGEIIELPSLLRKDSVNDSKTARTGSDVSNIVDVIIQFTDEPTVIRKNNTDLARTNSGNQDFQNRIEQFKSDLSNIQAKTSKNAKTGTPVNTPKIKMEYFRVFSGVNIEVEQSLLAELKKLPYIKNITKNRNFYYQVENAATKVLADSVRINYGVEGEGMVIAIIDSGVDYNHPALGGGFGPGYKVIGGYDFGEGDSDPMDDFLGHGTHVAGIVAADGETLKGIAPKASLLAYKVGVGAFIMESWIIAAIERCIDPNQDGDFSDRPHVVNISLGSPGHADDPVSLAVDNAVSLGMVFCVAAGNYGSTQEGNPNSPSNGLFSVTSPGTARNAITVGASDNNDVIAPFSSKGPTLGIGAMKPDVLAPGVNIVSTFLDNGYSTLSGTSMASPVVAGVCALLKQLHPDWTPAQIKSALITTAEDIGENVMLQGAGRINALEAVKANVFVHPADLSFGYVNYSQTIWESSQSITIENNTGQEKTYVVQYDLLPYGALLTASPQSFTISNGATQDVVMTLSINTSILPAADSTSGFLQGTMFFTDTEFAHTLKLPWSFSNVTALTVTLDIPAFFQKPAISLFNDKHTYTMNQFLQYDPFTYKVRPYAGIYDLVILAQGDDFMSPKNYVHITEELELNDSRLLPLNIKTTSTREIVFPTVDENGQPLSTLPFFSETYSLTIEGPNKFETFFITNKNNNDFLPPAPILFSTNISDRYTFIENRLINKIGMEGNKVYVTNAIITGLNPGTIFPQNNPTYYLKNDFTMYSSESYSTHYGGVHGFIVNAQLSNIIGNISPPTTVQLNDKNEWEGSIFVTPTNYQHSSWTFGVYAHNTYDFTSPFPPYPSTNSTMITTNLAVRNDGSILSLPIGDPGNSKAVNKTISEEGTFKFNTGLTHYHGPILGNTYAENSIALWSRGDFRGNLNGFRNYADDYGIFNLYDKNDNLIYSKTGIFDNDVIKTDLTPDIYRAEVIDTTYFVAGLKSTGKISATIDIANSNDAVSPMVTMLRLIDANGHSTNKFETADPATTLLFAVNDYNSFEYKSNVTARFYYKKNGTTDWLNLDITHIIEEKGIEAMVDLGHLYTADLEKMLDYDSALMDIKIEAIDDVGNKLAWTLEPAFLAVDNVITSLEEQIGTNRPSIGSVYPNPFSNSTKITFSLPNPENVTLSVYNVMGKKVNVLVNKPMAKGEHSIKWNGTNYQRKPLTNGVYIYKLEVGENFTHSERVLLIR